MKEKKEGVKEQKRVVKEKVKVVKEKGGVSHLVYPRYGASTLSCCNRTITTIIIIITT